MTPRPISPKTWDAIWTDYVQGTVLHRVTFVALALAHDVNARTIGRHARIHRWEAKWRAARLHRALQSVGAEYQMSLRASRRAVERLAPVLRGEDLPAILRAAKAADDELGSLVYLAHTLVGLRAKAARAKP